MDKYYKGDKITSNGMAEQHIFEIKEMWHSGYGASHIADTLNLTTGQVIIGINQNEPTPAAFTEADFN